MKSTYPFPSSFSPPFFLPMMGSGGGMLTEGKLPFPPFFPPLPFFLYRRHAAFYEGHRIRCWSVALDWAPLFFFFFLFSFPSLQQVFEKIQQ